MSTMADTLFADLPVPATKDRREAVYFRAMDYILYLRQDGPYVADRIDESLTLLLDPTSRIAIGVKLKGFHHTYLQLKKVLGIIKFDLEARIPFRTFISLAEVAALQVGKDLINDTSRRVQFDSYEVARRIVGAITVSASEFRFVEDDALAD
jgi:hypothetical protein